ncbi:hypothetical protein V5799_019839 [Amblyomma americanum]|uniref:Uncharacterized protein n=1 Tax=Amblyomma americanum TaxID=6943 RepID=A0AAQ4EVS5_AMBAM
MDDAASPLFTSFRARADESFLSVERRSKATLDALRRAVGTMFRRGGSAQLADSWDLSCWRRTTPVYGLKDVTLRTEWTFGHIYPDVWPYVP